tara:strand:- start:29 stop:1411 length:1383 start_codon:yes stop_codon:yes gene_type:complete
MATFLPFNKNILTPIGEPFERRLYGEKGLIDPLPEVLGSGILGDVAGKGPRTQRGLRCPTGTQPNASNTACVPIKKTGTCPAGTTGVWPNCTPVKVSGGTCPPGTTGVWPNCTRIKVGNGTNPTCASQGKIGTWPNCRDPVTVTEQQCGDGEVGRWPNCRPAQNLTEQDLFNLFDDRTVGPTTVADVGRVRQDPRTGQTITSTGISMADALKNYGLTPEESYRVTYSPYGAEERGQGAARGTWNPLSDPADLAARQAANLAAGGILSQSAFTPAQLSEEDFLAQYSRPSKTVEQGILGPDQEGAEARRIAEMQSEVYGMDNLFTPSPRARVTAGPTAAEIRNEESARQGREQSQRQQEARDKLAKIKDRQANEKEFKKSDVAAKKAEKKAKTAKKTASKAKAKAKSNPTPLNQKAAFMAQSNAQKATKSAVSKRNVAKEKKTKSIMGSENYAAYTRRGRK